jgi:hypothetical protein
MKISATVIALVALLQLNTSGATVIPASVTLDVGDAKKLELKNAGAGGPGTGEAKLESSDPKTVIVFPNGWAVALKIGEATITCTVAGAPAPALWTIKVVDSPERLVNPATLKQYPDNRTFRVGERKCVGHFLNGHMVGNEAAPSDRNRVYNPKPLRADRPQEWELIEGTPVYDGTGVVMGTAAPALDVNGRKVTATKFNYGFSKIVNGKLCLYGFTTDIRPSEAVKPLLDASERKHEIVGTSAWVPIEGVVEKELLLDNVGLGKGKLPRLPLEAKKFRITGGNPNQYMTDKGEVRIVDDPAAAPVPSHYLRRPTGTVNIIYCVPGFGLGGHSLDSVLVSSNAIFHPAKGVRTFTQPTYYPAAHPKVGQKSPKTMTFVFGAVEVAGSETIYGWVAREAMEPAP